MRKVLIFTLLMFVVTFEAAAQLERGDIRKGNRLFEDENYSESEVEYLRALGKNPKSYEANFNLGGSFFKQKRFKDAQETFMKSIKDSTSIYNKDQALYNLGTSYLAEKKLDESIKTFKDALRINPADTLAKYNLAYAQFLKKEQEDKDDQNKDDQDKDKEQDKDQDKDDQDQDKDKDDQDQDEEEDDKNEDEQDQDDEGEDQDQESEPEPREGQMTQQEAEQLLEAMQAQEDKTKDKMGEKKKGVIVGRSGKNW